MKLQSGQVAVVTGGASGIGWGLSRQFAERGLSVTLVDVEAGPLAEAQEKLEQMGATVFAVQTDVSDGAEMASLAAAVEERFGRVDVLCNNAGVGIDGLRPFLEFDERDWQWILGVNLWGVIHGLRHFLPTLIRQGHGHVVNTASKSALEIVPFDTPYTISKHAVVALSEALRFELATMAPGVGISVLCPGLTRTRIRDAERNRPADLVPTASAPAHDDAFLTEMLSAMLNLSVPEDTGPLHPDDVAAKVLAAIEDGTFYIGPHHTDVLDCIRNRVELLAALQRPDRGGSQSEGRSR
jgi:NAD(P)-dependent dehydrogenase (short-subunit alcohol dehydrogenase family)